MPAPVITATGALFKSRRVLFGFSEAVEKAACVRGAYLSIRSALVALSNWGQVKPLEHKSPGAKVLSIVLQGTLFG